MTEKDKHLELKINENGIRNNKSSYNEDSFDSFYSAADVLENIKVEKFSTGSSSLDHILGGGIETGSITQFYGSPGSGKSQTCLTTCALLPQKYGSIYIDTEGKFRPERLKQIAEERGTEPNEVLKNIQIAKTDNSQEMESAIDQIVTFLKSNKLIKLLIVDSLINHLRVEYQGRSQLPSRQQKLNLLMSKLSKIAIEKKVAVVITNHVQTDPSYFSSFDNDLPVGGNIINFASTHIIRLKRMHVNTHAFLIKSSYLPCNQSHFIINEKGIDDGRIRRRTKYLCKKYFSNN